MDCGCVALLSFSLLRLVGVTLEGSSFLLDSHGCVGMHSCFLPWECTSSLFNHIAFCFRTLEGSCSVTLQQRFRFDENVAIASEDFAFFLCDPKKARLYYVFDSNGTLEGSFI